MNFALIALIILLMAFAFLSVELLLLQISITVSTHLLNIDGGALIIITRELRKFKRNDLLNGKDLNNLIDKFMNLSDKILKPLADPSINDYNPIYLINEIITIINLRNEIHEEIKRFCHYWGYSYKDLVKKNPELIDAVNYKEIKNRRF